nr:MAP7 domain-containing protein 1-like [Ipomoea batatas]GME20394.1 MAP7 domain-containing protein 1-like [Ipomoea batatas]
MTPKFHFSPTDDECGELIYQKTLAGLEDGDDSSVNVNEELEGVVEISSLGSEASTSHMESRHATLRAHHKGKATTAEKGKGKVADAIVDLAFAVRLPATGMRNSDSSASTTAKREKCPSGVVLEDAAAGQDFIFRLLEQMIIASNLQAMEGVSLSYLLQSAAYHSFQAQLFQAGLNNAKDSELLKPANVAHSREVKALKADMTKLGASLATAQEGIANANETLRSAREDALKEFKESEDFHEEAMAHTSTHAQTIVDQWLEGEDGKRYLLDLGEADYCMGYQDAQKEIFEFLKARDVTFYPTIWGLLNLVTPDDHQGPEDATLNASVYTIGGEIPMDNAYLDSSANLDSVVGMDRASVPTLTEVGQGDMAATKEEDPSDAIQLNCQRSRSSERNLPTGIIDLSATN